MIFFLRALKLPYPLHNLKFFSKGFDKLSSPQGWGMRNFIHPCSSQDTFLFNSLFFTFSPSLSWFPFATTFIPLTSLCLSACLCLSCSLILLKIFLLSLLSYHFLCLLSLESWFPFASILYFPLTSLCLFVSVSVSLLLMLLILLEKCLFLISLCWFYDLVGQ